MLEYSKLWCQSFRCFSDATNAQEIWMKLREAYAPATTQCPQKGSAGAGSQDPQRLEKEKKCIDKTFNSGTFLATKRAPVFLPLYPLRLLWFQFWYNFREGPKLMGLKRTKSCGGQLLKFFFCKYWCQIRSQFNVDQTHFITNGSGVPQNYIQVVTSTLLRRVSSIQLASSSVAIFPSQSYQFKPY